MLEIESVWGGRQVCLRSRQSSLTRCCRSNWLNAAISCCTWRGGALSWCCGVEVVVIAFFINNYRPDYLAFVLMLFSLLCYLGAGVLLLNGRVALLVLNDVVTKGF